MNRNKNRIGSLFSILNDVDIKTAKMYFKLYPEKIKYSRAISGFAYSFINTPYGYFAISRVTIGAGGNGKVKIGKCLTTGKIVAVKIQLVKSSLLLNNYAHNNIDSEAEILKELNQFYSMVYRWRHEGTSNYSYNAQTSWTHKKGKNKRIVYDCKVYLFSVFFSGTTLYDYLLIEKKYHNLSLIQTLKIVITVLKKIQEIHQKNIIHGDLNFNNILIETLDNHSVEINIIDFGFSNKAPYGMIKFPVAKYTYDPKRHFAPECDFRQVIAHVFPVVTQNINQNYCKRIFNMIYLFSRKCYGFNIFTSDLYSFCRGVLDFTDLLKIPEILEIHKEIYNFNPYARPGLNTFIAKHEQFLSLYIFRKSLNIKSINYDHEKSNKKQTKRKNKNSYNYYYYLKKYSSVQTQSDNKMLDTSIITDDSSNYSARSNMFTDEIQSETDPTSSPDKIKLKIKDI